MTAMIAAAGKESKLNPILFSPATLKVFVDIFA